MPTPINDFKIEEFNLGRKLMDGIHDLGGKQGYGPIDVDEVDTPFHHDWEARECSRLCPVKSR